MKNEKIAGPGTVITIQRPKNLVFIEGIDTVVCIDLSKVAMVSTIINPKESEFFLLITLSGKVLNLSLEGESEVRGKEKKLLDAWFDHKGETIDSAKRI